MPGLRSAARALVVEDEARYRAFLLDVLRDMNCAAVGAANAREALAAIEGAKPDILLLDLNLPFVDGLTFLEEFRKKCPGAAVVIITGFGTLEAARRAIRLGVSDFLTKPCDLGQIEGAIDRARRRVSEARERVEVEEPVVQAPESPQAEVKSLALVEREAIIEALKSSG